MSNTKQRNGFTIVELLVVIVVIAILATISIVSYGAWKKSAATAQVKSDLNAVAAAMESARTFGSGYPQSPLATTLTAFSPSNGVAVSGGGAIDGLSYCVDGTSSQDATVQYYVASETKDQGPLSGTCATRPTLPAPGMPTNLAVTSAISTNVGLSWGAATNAVTYTAQCASDAGFIVGVQSTTTAALTATVSGLSPSNTYYCRVNAVNANSTSTWSTAVSTTTNSSYGSLAVATSIDGYWTSPPQGFLLEDGSAVSRSTYSDLFTAIGTTYGAGDGMTTFNLPDSRGRTSVDLSTDVEFATIGQKTGSKTEALTIAQMPSHTHPLAVGTIDDQNFTGYSYTSSYQNPPADGPGVYYPGQTTASTGGGGSHNNIQPSIVVLSVIKYAPIDASAVSLTPGTSIQGYWSAAPSGYAVEDGSAVSRTTYAGLFATIGTSYGVGDGSTTFNLPDSRGRAAVNISASDAEFNTMGEKYGEKTHTLTIAEMPAHSHGIGIGTTDDLNFTGYASASQYPPSDGPGTYWTGNITASAGGGGSHNNIQPSITKLSVIKLTAATTSGTDLYPGTSLQGYWATVPSGYLAEDGSAVSRTTYAGLFSAIGTTYGAGDGSTTFNLPDSRGRLEVNKNSSDTQFATMGEKYGEKTHTLTIAEMPSHNHGQPIGTIDDKNFTGYSSPGQYPPADGPGVYWTGQTTGSTGGSGAHNEIQPSIVKMFAIKF